ncbi:hypothetical protein [Paenibacillus eucommiae]|uniref:Lipoprotein n=1 Tax=Paenibacillus eucommiae TaxID=1355755 RepID=A0ABS4IQA1_9BACL|nr:hypothetical protein [Paenibacillus eucommiae]MBP1989081.1 hypothetical protein [Paenibacillus eucommiae]
MKTKFLSYLLVFTLLLMILMLTACNLMGGKKSRKTSSKIKVKANRAKPK